MNNRVCAYKVSQLTKSLLLGVMFILSAGNIYASNDNDSIIDVSKYLIASWFHGIDKDRIDSAKWYNNTSFTINLNPEMMWDRARYNHNFYNFGMSLTKEFNSSSALSFGMNFANSDKTEFNFRRIGGEIGYIWNLTNYYYGLRLSRRNNLSATTGLELGSISADNNYSRFYYGGYLGLRFSRTYSPHTSFFIEPRIGLYSDSYDALSNVEGFDAMATAHVGMNYKLSEMLNDVKPKKPIPHLHMRNWFIEFGGDVMLPVPKVDFVSAESSYTDRINFGASLGFGYRVNPLTSARARFTYSNDRYSTAKQYMGSFDIMFSGTKIFLGVEERRHIDMALVLGPLIQFAKYQNESSFHLSWGGEAGLQFTRRFNKNWELFAEPRFQLIQDYTKTENSDLHLHKQWDVNIGMIYLYDQRTKQKYDRWFPMRNWYFQTLAGTQLASLPTGHQIGNFDFVIGRHFTPLWNAQVSVFSGTLQSNEPDYDESWNPMYVTYLGGRAEIVLNFLRMLSPSLEDSRWNLNVSGGFEMGHLSNHYNKDFAVVAGSQLQYRFSRNAWLTAGGRIEQLFKFDAKLPLSGHIGIQYDIDNERRIDIPQNNMRWYVQNSIGFRNAFFNMDNLAYGIAGGFNFTPVHGVRLEFIGTKANKSEGVFRNWFSLSPDYVFSLSNKLLGEDNLRKYDIELISGFDVMLHQTNLNQTKLGFNLGTQINAHLSNSIALFVEPRFTIQTFDNIIAPSGHDVVQFFTLFGIRYSHNRFKSLK